MNKIKNVSDDANNMGQTSKFGVGIDLGTTYSAVAYVDEHGVARSVDNANGETLTPSAICFEENNIVIGRDAIKASAFLPDNYFDCFKREMGEHRIFEVSGVDTPAEILSALMLDKLKVEAEQRIGPIHHVVITVPAYFDESRRQSTIIAAKLAGLNVIDIINEPTSAAVAFGAGREGADGRQVLVYDLGGGTFDVSLLKTENGNFVTIATDGDVRLGGKDFDERLVNYFAEEFQKEHGVDPRLDMHDVAQLWLDAEETKKSLTERESVPHIMHSKGLRHRIVVTREIFNDLTSDLLRRTASTVKLLLRDAEVAWEDIDDLLIVGGSSRMPAVAAMLEEISGIKPNFSVNPDVVVSHGAALLCHSLLNRESSDINLVNVNSHSLGVIGLDPKTKRRFNQIIIPKNTQIPFNKTKTFITGKSGQSSVSIPVVEGESRRPEECSLIGKCTVRDLPKGLPQGTKVRVHFSYDASGRLAVSARIPATRQSATTVIDRKTVEDYETLDVWKTKFTGASSSSEGDRSKLLRRLDILLAKIAQGESGKVFSGNSGLSARIDQLKEALEQQFSSLNELKRKQTAAQNRLRSMEFSGQLAKVSTTITSIESEIEFAQVEIGRQIVQSNAVADADKTLASEARSIIASLS